MSDSVKPVSDAYAHQQAILARCYHPSGTFIRFEKEELERSIPSRFERQVRANPDQIAIKTRSDELTYHELNQAANRVAHAVLEQGGPGEEPVALLFEQGVQAIAAILGVLKAGKIYVPLDPSLPLARITYMLADTQARVIVTNNNLSLDRNLAQNEHELINIDEIDPGVSDENLDLSIPADALAYILYTSGSTGWPKGIVENHRNVLHSALDHTNIFHICAYDRLTLLYSIGLNGAVRDVFSSLLNGASLYPYDLKKEGAAKLADWLVREAITIWHSSPTVFRHFASTLTGEEKFPKLRLIYSGGEPVYKLDVELYRKHSAPDCIFVNVLGSTEVQNFQWYFVDQEMTIMGGTVPVGYTVSEMEVLLLDDNGGEVGRGSVGEIAVKSRYLSPGYWRSPDLTRATFLPDPNGGDDRIFLTGDLGRMLQDGCLGHLGRKDRQVKIRGYRVEVGEIEMALVGLDAVNGAVVMSREDLPGHQRLVAYVVPTAQPAPTVGGLRRVLSETLPDYMLPSAFVFLDILPLLPSGKVDRLALPQPGSERPNLDSPYAAPRTPVEETLVRIWSDVLRLDQVGIHDDFMELGGHSLLATQVVSRVISAFRVEVPLRSVFEASTVARMAVLVTQSRAKEAEQADVERLLGELEALSDEQAKRLLDGRDH